MKKKPEKQKDMEALQSELAKASNVFLTSYEKLTVDQDFELRKTVQGVGGNYKVVKNNRGRSRRGNSFRRPAQGHEGYVFARLYFGRSGGAGESADGIRESESQFLVQSRDG